MKPIERKLRAITAQYKKLFPAEYRATVAHVAARRKTLKTDYAELGGNGTIHRALIEWPETLFGMLQVKLTTEEYKAMFQDKKHVLLRWYAGAYPEFRLSKEV